MALLPDIPAGDYNAYQAQQFAALTQPLLDAIGQGTPTPASAPGPASSGATSGESRALPDFFSSPGSDTASPAATPSLAPSSTFVDPTLSPNQQTVAAGGTPSLRARNLISNQFDYQTDQELTPQEAASACGPTAALAFARYAGRNPTIGEALSLAKEVGWTPSLGMAGPQSEVSLLGSLGASSQYNPGASAQDVASEVQAGRPVILDTPNHYFAIDDFNPQNGLFHVGGSGLALRGGSEWMSWSQIAAHGAGVRGSITLAGGQRVPPGMAAGQSATLAPAAPAAAPGDERQPSPVAEPFAQFSQRLLSSLGSGPGGGSDAASAPGPAGSAPTSPATAGSPTSAPRSGGASPRPDSFAAFSQGLIEKLSGANPQRSSPSPTDLPANPPGNGTEGVPASPLISTSYNDMAGASSSPPVPALTPSSTFVDPSTPSPSSLRPSSTFVNPASPNLDESGLSPDTLPTNLGSPLAQPTPLPSSLPLPSLSDVAGAAGQVLSAPADVIQGSLPALGGNQASPGDRLATAFSETDPSLPLPGRMAAALKAFQAPFEQTLDYGASIDPSGGALIGTAAAATRLATDPTVMLGLPAYTPAMGIGAAAGDLAGLAAAKATNANPEQTSQLAQTGAGLGTVAGPVGETLGHAIGALAPGVSGTLATAAEDLAGAPGAALAALRTSPLGQSLQDAAHGVAPLLQEAGQLADTALRAPYDLGVSPGLSIRPVSSNAATQQVMDMYAKPPPPGPATTGVIERARQAFVRAWTDSRGDLGALQSQGVKALGSLAPEQQVYELASLNPTVTAQVGLQRDLVPAIQSVGKDRPFLSAYLTHADNVDVANAMGAKVAQPILDEQLKVPAQQQIARAQAQLRMYQRLRAAGVASGDGTVVTHYDELIGQRQTYLKGAQTRLTKQMAAAQADQTARASQASTTAIANRKFANGVSAARSAQALTDMAGELGPQRFAKVQAAANQVYAFNQGLLQKKVGAGLITQQLADELTRTYPHYVRTEITEHLTDPNAIPSGRSLSVSDVGLRRVSVAGSTSAREDPLVSTIRNAYETQSLVNRNVTFNALVNLTQAVPELASQIKPVANDFAATRSQAVVRGFVNGKAVTYAMPTELESAIRFEGTSPIPGLNHAMAVVRAVAATRNPLFLPVHAQISVVPYILRSLAREGGPLPGNLARVIGALAPAYLDAFRGILSNTYHGNAATYLEAGGGMFSAYDSSVSGGRQALGDLTRRGPLDIQSKGDLLRVIRDAATFQPVESIINRVDLAPRVAAYNLAKARGLSEAAAASAGRTATIDFQQGGTYARVLNQFIPFFNVAIQGGAQLPRMIADNPRAAISTLAALAVPLAAAEAWNNADPQRQQDYADVPQYVKDRGVVVMLPGPAPVDAQGNRHPQMATLQLRGFAPVAIATRAILAHALGEDPRGYAELLGSVARSELPIQGDTSASALSGFVPPGLKEGLELATNRDFFGNRDIATKANDASASPLAQTVAGAIGARPSQVDYGVSSLGGGIGKLAQSASSLGQPTRAGDTTPQGIPIVGAGLQALGLRGDIGQQETSARNNLVTPSARAFLDSQGMRDYAPVALVGSKYGITLTRGEAAAEQRLVNQRFDVYLQNLRLNPDFATLTPAEKQQAVSGGLSAIHTYAIDEALGQIPEAELRRRYALTNPAGG